jgi:hypothetical protein
LTTTENLSISLHQFFPFGILGEFSPSFCQKIFVKGRIFRKGTQKKRASARAFEEIAAKNQWVSNNQGRRGRYREKTTGSKTWRLSVCGGQRYSFSPPTIFEICFEASPAPITSRRFLVLEFKMHSRRNPSASYSGRQGSGWKGGYN